MYLHEVYKSSYGAGFRHYRQTNLLSGLIQVEEIARTSTRMSTTQPSLPTSSSLIIPHRLASAPAETKLPTQSINCDDIASFVHEGIKAWRSVLEGYRDSTYGIELSLAEARRGTETIHTSGIVLPGDPDDQGDFLHFYANDSEINALNTMQAAVNAGAGDESVGVGNYL